MDKTDNIIEVVPTVDDKEIEEKIYQRLKTKLRSKRNKRYAAGAGLAALVVTLVVILASKGESTPTTIEVVVPETDNS